MDLDNAEGRVAALQRCVPMVGQIKDPTLRDEYARQLAGWVGWADVAQIIDRVRTDAKNAKAPAARGSFAPNPRRRGTEQPAESGPAEPAARPDPRDPTPGMRPCAQPSTRPVARQPESPAHSGSMRCAKRPHRR